MAADDVTVLYGILREALGPDFANAFEQYAAAWTYACTFPELVAIYRNASLNLHEVATLALIGAEAKGNPTTKAKTVIALSKWLDRGLVSEPVHNLYWQYANGEAGDLRAIFDSAFDPAQAAVMGLSALSIEYEPRPEFVEGDSEEFEIPEEFRDMVFEFSGGPLSNTAEPLTVRLRHKDDTDDGEDVPPTAPPSGG